MPETRFHFYRQPVGASQKQIGSSKHGEDAKTSEVCVVEIEASRVRILGYRDNRCRFETDRNHSTG